MSEISWFDYLIKINSDSSLHFILIRTVIIYIYAIFLIRIGNKRFNFETSFDFVLIIIIGAVLSRPINGTSTLVSAMLGGALLIFLHWIFAIGAFHSHRFGKWIKGDAVLLIQDGKLIWSSLKKNQITEEDLREMVREKLNEDDFKTIKKALLERTGRISFIKKE